MPNCTLQNCELHCIEGKKEREWGEEEKKDGRKDGRKEEGGRGGEKKEGKEASQFKH